MTHSQVEPVLVIVVGIVGALACAYFGFLTASLIFCLVAIGGAFEFRATRLFNEEWSEGFDGDGVNGSHSPY